MSPIKTLKQMPVGMKKFVGDIQAQQAVGKVYGESGSSAHAQVKREMAAKLGVDPYTDNEPLQNLLNEAAKHRSRGQLVASLSTLVIGGGAGLALNVVEMNDEFTALIRNKSAAQLQVDNQAALVKLGCHPAAVGQLLSTPGYTATNCTAITRAMVTLGTVQGVCGLLHNLPPVAGPESVLFNQTQIQMAAHFHRTQSRLTSVRFIGGTAVWTDARGISYVFSPLEYLYWNEEVDLGLSNLRREVSGGEMQFWISGTATPTAKAMLHNRGVSVRENSLLTLRGRENKR